MRSQVILDTGPLVAYISARDTYHAWAKAQFSNIQPPVFTCEAVISETCFLLRNYLDLRKILFEWIQQNIIQINFNLQSEAAPIKHLLERYKNVPMSLADACLVRMSEQISGSTILTLDTDFSIYKKHGRTSIPTIVPDKK